MSSSIRDVVVGRHSLVWHKLEPRLRALGREVQAVGHDEVKSHQFGPQDRVWILSYSRRDEDNARLLRVLEQSNAGELVYVSSSAAIVASRTDCYEYPKAKALAERRALQIDRAHVLTIGLMYESPSELPAGDTVATSYDELARFFVELDWGAKADGRARRLFNVVRRDMPLAIERIAYRCYGRLIAWTGRFPCVLRPLDLALRMLGCRWYGYTYLSNKLWTSTTL